MAGECNYKTQYENDDTFSPSKLPDRVRMLAGEPDAARAQTGRKSLGCSPNFELIDGLLYRKKLERGFIHYREVLDEDRRFGAIATFHRRRPGTRHHSLEDTYRSVAENYWWEGMYFQIRDFVLGCPECLEQRNKRLEKGVGESRLSQTMMSHSRDVLNKLRSQREAGLFCDITLRTDGRSYSAHKAVLVAVSEYFQEVFTEMDSAPSASSDIDLTGFSESSLVSLLDFSYSSTLCVSEEDLSEVSTMARHLGMWPAVEACTALQREQADHTSRYPNTEHSALGFPSQCPGSPMELRHHQKDRKTGLAGEGRERVAGGRVVRGLGDGFRLILDQSDESGEESPTRRSPRRPLRPSAHPPGRNGLPLSPMHRMKLMDFKSPSCKITSSPRKNVPSNPRSRNVPSSSLPHTCTRLLRSTPRAAKEVQSMLPRTESPPQGRKPPPVPCPAFTSSRQRTCSEANIVRVEEEDEKDDFRALEKYRLMSVLGLQRTSLLPRPEDLIGWRQKKRLRKLKVNNYSLTKRRKPRPQGLGGLVFGGLPLSLPLCTPANAHFLNRIIKKEPVYPISMEDRRLKRSRQPRPFPPSDRSMRSKVALPDLLQPVSRPAYGGRDLRRSVRGEEVSHPPPHLPPRSGNARVPNPKRNISALRIKPEHADYAISALQLPSHGQRPNTHIPPPRAHPRNKVTLETVRVLRYNSGCLLAKAKPERSGMKEAGRAKHKPREKSRRTGCNQGARGVMERGPGALSRRKNSSILSPDNVPPPLHSHPLYRVIKEEPADPLPVVGPFPESPSPELGKRQIKPPVKLLDPGFLFSFCRPPGGPMVGVKREEESVDICLTRSVSRGERLGPGGGPDRVLRARGGPPTLPMVQKEREEKSVNQSQTKRQGPPRAVNIHQHKAPHLVRAKGSKGAHTARDIPKKQAKPLHLPSRGPALLDSICRARLKQLRGPRSQAPKAKSSHVCLQCRASYKDCTSLLMHRIRHIEGKHWPCPLCSKTFFRMRNVKNHIRTHDQRLYKCRSCIAAS